MFAVEITRRTFIQYLSVAVILVLVVVSSTPQNTVRATPSSGWLQPENRWIVDGQGNIVALTGFNTYIRYENYRAKFANASAAGFTTVRLILVKSDIENPTYNTPNYDMSGLAAIDKAVGWCQGLGIRVILDQHHWTGSIWPAPIQFWTNTTLQQQWLNMWKLLVDRYKTNPTVVGVDLMNEPYSTKAYGTPPPNVEAIWERIAENAITQLKPINPNLLFIVEDWGIANQWQDVNFLKQNSVVYEPHLYYHDQISWNPYAESYAAGKLALAKQQFASWIDTKFTSYANQGIPVWVGETGFLTSDPYWSQEMQDQLSLLDARGIGYSAFVYGVWPMNEPYAITVNAQSNYALAPQGQILSNHLLGLTATTSSTIASTTSSTGTTPTTTTSSSTTPTTTITSSSTTTATTTGIAEDKKCSAVNAYTSTTSCSLTAPASNVLIIMTLVKTAGSTTITTVATIGGVAATGLANDTYSGKMRTEIWYLFVASPSNPTTCSVRYGAKVRSALTCESFTGTATSAPFFEDTSSSVQGGGASPQTMSVKIVAGTTGRWEFLTASCASGSGSTTTKIVVSLGQGSHLQSASYYGGSSNAYTLDSSYQASSTADTLTATCTETGDTDYYAPVLTGILPLAGVTTTFASTIITTVTTSPTTTYSSTIQTSTPITSTTASSSSTVQTSTTTTLATASSSTIQPTTTSTSGPTTSTSTSSPSVSSTTSSTQSSTTVIISSVTTTPTTQTSTPIITQQSSTIQTTYTSMSTAQSSFPTVSVANTVFVTVTVAPQTITQTIAQPQVIVTVIVTAGGVTTACATTSLSPPVTTKTSPSSTSTTTSRRPCHENCEPAPALDAFNILTLLLLIAPFIPRLAYVAAGRKFPPFY